MNFKHSNPVPHDSNTPFLVRKNQTTTLKKKKTHRSSQPDSQTPQDKKKIYPKKKIIIKRKKERKEKRLTINIRYKNNGKLGIGSARDVGFNATKFLNMPCSAAWV